MSAPIRATDPFGNELELDADEDFEPQLAATPQPMEVGRGGNLKPA